MIIKKIYENKIIQFCAKSLNVNSTLISLNNKSYIIDSLLFPKDSKSILEYLNSHKIFLNFIINTHFHSDHCYGNKIIKMNNTKIIGHELFQSTIDSEKQMVKGKSKITKKKIATPDITFKDSFQLDENIHIIYTPGHSADSCSVFIPNQKIVIVGDLVINSIDEKYALPYFYWGDLDEMITSFEKILALDVDQIIPGHGKIVRKDKIISDLKYLKNLSLISKQLYANKQLEKLRTLPVSLFTENQNLKIWNGQIHTFNVDWIMNKYFNKNFT